MTFVLDNSVTMCWLFNDGSDADIAYADKVLTQLASSEAIEQAVEQLRLPRMERHVWSQEEGSEMGDVLGRKAAEERNGAGVVI